MHSDNHGVPIVDSTSFKNRGRTHPDDCAVNKPPQLGVGVREHGRTTLSNAMELRFTLDGHRAGLRYEITRRRSNSIWGRKQGSTNWSSFETQSNVLDDRRPALDECLSPKNNRIFSIDRPGWPETTSPVREGTRLSKFSGGSIDSSEFHDLVAIYGFTEAAFVQSKRNPRRIPWTKISDSIHWYCIIWLTRRSMSSDGIEYSALELDFRRSAIDRGAAPALSLPAPVALPSDPPSPQVLE